MVIFVSKLHRGAGLLTDRDIWQNGSDAEMPEIRNEARSEITEDLHRFILKMC